MTTAPMTRESTRITSIGLLGPEGSHSEEALLTLQSTHPSIFKDHWGRLSRESSLRDLISGLLSGHFNAMFVPIENATEGTVREVMDALSFEFDTPSIQLEWVHPITHALITKASLTEPITSILSHPQALAQSRTTLKEKYPNAELIPTASTSQAVASLLSAQTGVAALGSPSAAQMYGLQILEHNTCDNPWNTTRFVLVCLDNPHHANPANLSFETLQTVAAAPLKTSLCLGPKLNTPGALSRIVQIVADYGLDMTQIVSRPAKKQLGEYIFYIDFLGTASPPFYEALSEVCGFIRRLGVYPSLEHPDIKNL
jgi:prephenate dehydratase